MIKLITAVQYAKGLKWKLRRNNAVDTVVFQLLSNDEEESVVASGALRTLDYRGNTYSLPLGSQAQPDILDAVHTHVSIGQGRTCIWHNGPYDYAWGQVSVLLGEKNIPITLSSPVVGNLSLHIDVKGVTTETTTSIESNYKNPRDGNYKSADIVTMIRNNSPTVSSEWSNASNYKEYNSANGVDLNPFVSYFIRANGEDTSEANLTPASDLITRWNGYNGSMPLYWTCATSEDWYTAYYLDAQQQIGSLRPGNYYQWPAAFYDSQGGSTFYKEQRSKGFTQSRLKLKRDVNVIDDYHVTISITEPIRLIYSAFAKYNRSDWILVESPGEQFLDAKAFFDDITEISYTLTGYRVSSKATEYSYSLDSFGELTESSININVLRIPSSLFMTASSSFPEGKIKCSPDILAGQYVVGYSVSSSTVNWKDFWAKKILYWYKKGKYVVEVEVPALWAIENEIEINTECNIKLPDNTYIGSYENNVLVPSTLVVKNITKIYNNRQFIYRLQLTEKGLEELI